MPTTRSAEFTQISDRIVEVLRRRVGKDERAAKPHDWYTAAVYTLRDAVIDRWMDSTRRTYETKGNVAESGLAEFGSLFPGDESSRPAGAARPRGRSIS